MTQSKEEQLVDVAAWLVTVEKGFGILGQVLEEVAKAERMPTPRQAAGLSKQARRLESQAQQLRAMVAPPSSKGSNDCRHLRPQEHRAERRRRRGWNESRSAPPACANTRTELTRKPEQAGWPGCRPLSQTRRQEEDR